MDDPGGEVEDGGGGGGGPLDSEVKASCVVQRLALAAKGIVSLGVSYSKYSLAVGSAASTPVTGVVGAAGTAYGLVGASGNLAAGFIQIVGAITGQVKQAQEGASVAASVTTVGGFSALVATKGNIETASKWAAAESVGTAGAQGGFTGHLIDEAATSLQKFFLAVDLGQATADTLGVKSSPGCQQGAGGTDAN